MSAFIESIRLEIRTLQYSLKTEKTYLYWCRYFIRFNHLKHPNMMGNAEIERFLSHLAKSAGSETLIYPALKINLRGQRR